MDRISGKIIKYAGVWQKDVFSLATPIAIGATQISVTKGTQSISAIEDDLISIKIDGIRMICKLVNSTTLEIVESPTRSADIQTTATVLVYKHLVSNAPEDLVTRFELNQLKMLANSSSTVLIADVSGKSNDTYDLNMIDYDGQITLQILEKIGNAYEISDVEYTINNNYLEWDSMTIIPEGIAIISFLPSKNIA